MTDIFYLGGWIDDGGHVVIGADLPTVAALGPSIGPAGEPTQPILLYRAWHDVAGSYPDYPAQTIGDCVGQGHAHANDLSQCVEIALGEQSEYFETCTEQIYAASREVAGILGRGDGSYGAAAVKAMHRHGMISREMLGDSGGYSGQRARSWGRTGVPAEIESLAREHLLRGAARVPDWQSLVGAIWTGWPVTICSNQGFTMTRDAQGFCSPRGRWAHCMFIAALRFDRPGACIVQSWGPDTPSGPLALDQPSYSFWADRRVVESILSAGDSWAIVGSPAFPSRPLPARWSLV